MEKTKEIDILDVLIVLAKHKKFIIWTTLIVSIAAVVYSLVIPKYWVSTATIMPAQERKSQLSLGSSSIFNLGSSIFGSSVHTSSLELITVMNSRSFIEDVIEEFNLTEYLEIEHPDSFVVKDIALLNFREKIRRIGFDEETGLISISIETKDKFLSADIANYMWQKLEEYNLEYRMSKGKQQRIFLEERISEIETEIDSLQYAILQFQKDNNIINLEEQTLNAIKQYSSLIAEQKALQIEIDFIKKTQDEQNPVLDNLMTKNQILKKQISNLEVDNSATDYQYFLSLRNVPKYALDYASLSMSLEIQKQLYSFLYPQYEQARIEEIKDLPSLEIIDHATPAGLRSKPKRAQLCIIAFLLAFLISSFLAYTMHMIKHSEASLKIREIVSLIFGKSENKK